MAWRSWAAGAVGLAVTGCGNGVSPENPPAIQDRVSLTAFSGAGACTELEQYLEDNAVRMMRTQIEAERDNVPSWGWWGGGLFGRGGIDDFAAPSAGAGAEKTAAPKDYTTTNTQVAGVDEADFVKNDGTRIFVLSGDKLYASLSWPATNLSLQGKVQIEGYPREMFLADDSQVVVFSSIWQALPLSAADGVQCKGLDCGYYYANSVKVTVVDAKDLGALKVAAEYYLPGSYTNSRRVGDSVRVVMSDGLNFPPAVQWWPQGNLGSSCWGWGSECKPEDKKTRDAAFDNLIKTNEALIRGTSLAQWLPAGRLVKDGKTTMLPPDCSAFSKVNAPVRMGQLSVATLNLKNPGTISRTNVLAETGEVYASAKNLYVATRHWWWWPAPGQKDVTYIHKFDISQPDTAKYVASGTAPGSILDQFSMDENDQGYFRMATTLTRRVIDTAHPDNWFGQIETSNQVTVLAESKGVLEVVGQSEELGKGERLQSSRFVGDKGYLVTFRNTDPLFTFDLKDPRHPVKVGELKVPGFSSYIHPVGDGTLLTIGTYVPEDMPNWQGRRIQLSLFDVSNMAAPKLTHTTTLGDASSYSEAQWEHKAFNYFAAKKLLAVPFSDWSWGGGNGDYWSAFVSDLRVFSVDPVTGFQALGRVGMSDLYKVHNYWGWSYYWQPAVRRSVMADDFVYAISDAGIRVAHIGALGSPLATVQFDRYDNSY
ncbi:MAG: beta-propeller domain-containing protein [Archangiaceae bacterium]|nr:beta-propeller domain-containing protein [Archangiaceae bacterium]